MKLRITLDGVTYDLDVEFVDEDGGAVTPIPVPSTRPAPAKASGSPAPAPTVKPPPSLPQGGDDSVTCPISGTVFKILVKVGDTVATNQDLIILEAMKMETNIVAAAPGTISNIAVAEGDTVSQGQLLIEFE